MKTENFNLPPITAAEYELLLHWREVARDRHADDQWARIERRERRLGRAWWDQGAEGETGARSPSAWSRADLQAARWCICIGGGGTISEAQAASGITSWAQWQIVAGPTSWIPIYAVARETSIDTLTAEATDRLRANAREGQDGGHKSAAYLLDWWRSAHGMGTADRGQQPPQAGGGGITYNIAILGSPPGDMCSSRVADSTINAAIPITKG